MKKVEFGNTGITVTPLCFGVLSLGPQQANLSLEEGARVVRYALEMGINFFDTAEIYGTNHFIREGCKGFDCAPVISGRSGAATYEEMKEAFTKQLEELGIERIDLFSLHGVASAEDYTRREGAVHYLLEMKARGAVRAIGASMHSAQAAQFIANVQQMDFIFPMFNIIGSGIIDGTPEDVLIAMRDANANGKGIIIGKALAGSGLYHRVEEALNYVRGFPEIHAVAIGMQTEAEVEFNVRLFSDVPIPDDLREAAMGYPKRLYIRTFCKGCGNCVKRCLQNALTVEGEQARVDQSKCVLCGYCITVCPVFALKILRSAPEELTRKSSEEADSSQKSGTP